MITVLIFKRNTNYLVDVFVWYISDKTARIYEVPQQETNALSVREEATGAINRGSKDALFLGKSAMNCSCLL